MRKILVIVLLMFICPIYSDNSMTSIQYWMQNYQGVHDGNEYEMAHSVFQKILLVCDKSMGITPRLYIFSDLKLNQLFATRDGGIILPFEVIKFCRKDKKNVEARLAFLLGHEIKHIVRGDYEKIDTIIKFFDSIEKEEKNIKFGHVLEKVGWTMSNNQKRFIETEADQFGILYALLAGYQLEEIFTPKNNFISEFYQFAGLDIHGDISHPSAMERYQNTLKRMNQILDNIHLFYIGSKFYAIGQYEAAINLLSEFIRVFPSREVYNNRGLCYYQKALRDYTKLKPGDIDSNPNFMFKLSLQCDLISRVKIHVRSMHSNTENNVHQTIQYAIHDFQEAIRRDPEYPIAYNNIGCAFLLQGAVDFAKGNFKKAIEYQTSYKEAHNNLGVCYIAEENGEMAQNSFLDASRIDPIYSDPYFNLGKLYELIGKNEDAEFYYNQFIKIDTNSKYSEMIRKKTISKNRTMGTHLIETIAEKSIMIFEFEKIEQNKIFTQQGDYLFWYIDSLISIGACRFIHGASSKEIFLVWTGPLYRGQTANGIQVGSPEALICMRYPSNVTKIPTTLGTLYLYPKLQLVFEVRCKKVYGWSLYDVRG